MTKREAIETLKDEADYLYGDDKPHNRQAFDMGIEALGLIGSLNERPCEACVHHGENGCCKWTCVFDHLLYIEHEVNANE